MIIKSTISLLIVLADVMQALQGYKKIVTVNTNGNNTEDCLEGDYPCSSLGYVLNHLQSNDCVNITSNSVPLTTIVELHNLNAITIRGQGNTIVMCNNTGGVSCYNCSNVVIEGITWDGCGDPQQRKLLGGINFNQLTNLFIKNCTFKHSKLRALYLQSISGLIQFVDTKFSFNTNNDVIYCFQAQTGYKHCTTDNYTATGGVVFKIITRATNVTIINCAFNNNGHFGQIIDIDFDILPPKAQEIADGAGLLLISNNIKILVNVLIKDTLFSSNCGRGGAGAYIRVKNSSFVTLQNVKFYNNSAVKTYVTASALWVHFYHLDHISLPKLHLSSCSFFNNKVGKNMISFFLGGGNRSHTVIENCSFVNSLNHADTIIELFVTSQSLIDIVNSNFSDNKHGALVYAQVRFVNVTFTMENLNIVNNSGLSLHKPGRAFLFFELFEDNCVVNLTRLIIANNHFASNIKGGGIYITGTYEKIFTGNIQNSTFESNFGFGAGSVIHTSLKCSSVLDNSYTFSIDSCSLRNNTGYSIVYVAMEYNAVPAFLLLNAEFINNSGAPLKLLNTILVSKGNITFQHNKATKGAGLYLSDSYILLNYSSFHINIINNHANMYGGGIYVTFSLSNLDNGQCHWLLFPPDNFCSVSTDFFYKHISDNCITSINTKPLCKEFPQSEHAISTVDIINNTALWSGNAVFYDGIDNVRGWNNATSSVFYIPETFTVEPNATELLAIATPPKKLLLKSPAKCNDDYTMCRISGIALGQEISAPAVILGYNSQPAEPTRFFVTCNCSKLTSVNETFILVKDKLHGIKIIGNYRQAITQSITLSLRLNSKGISFELIIEIVPCHLGYVYTTAGVCDCYDTHQIVKCQSKMTTIKKNYWFGTVSGQTTLSRCPNKYCNFTRREVISGRYLLPLAYDDQCGLHRTGPACGRCSNGYTLSYDFDYCVDINSCSPGITVLVMLFTILYWIIIIVVVLGLMHYQISVGFFYGIIHFYSVVDMLLGQLWDNSFALTIFDNALFTTVRLNPAFLGRLCFIQGMSGIDQYVLYYIHPTAIALILVVLAIFARHSMRFATFISKGIIHVVCLILTLTYTAIANTSLQLLRLLRFTDINIVYCYLSPDIRYFTGRHITYVIIALVYELLIVSGLPLLLLLEPFVNSKINFTKIKPLLDQFQGCYKDKCRWFAAIYLLCRQVILIILIIDFSNDNIALYLLISVCVLIALVHITIQPYKSEMLNKYDGFILLLLILVVSLQMAVLSESINFTNTVIIVVVYGLIILPLVVLAVIAVCMKYPHYFNICKLIQNRSMHDTDTKSWLNWSSHDKDDTRYET